MLTRMDVQTAHGAALPLGIAVAVGVLALALAAALVLSWRRPPRVPASAAQAAPPGTYPDDDLPSFREHPPGFPGARPVPAGGAARAGTPAAVGGRGPLRTITVLALLALLLIGTAAVVAAVAAAAEREPASGSPAPTTAAPSSGALAARGAFGGVVLERHPAGITVTYPTLTVEPTGASTAEAHVQLPTWNCMTDRPPADPAAAGCRATVVEYADLPAARIGDGLRLHGRCATYLRPSGGEEVATGRVYDLAVTLRPGDPLPDGWTAASGELALGGGHTSALGGGATALRPGG
jgi:hypothetical protein